MAAPARRFVLVASLCVSAQALAQHSLDTSNLYPVTGPIQHAGTFNLARQRWMSPSAPALAGVTPLIIYDNTCTWSGGAYYTGVGSCETYIDEGEIPGPDNPAAPLGAPSDNNVVMAIFSYCTNFVVPDVKLGFYDSLGGDCFNQVNLSPTHPLPALACPASVTPFNPQGTAYYDLTQAGLPGGAGGGPSVSCWVFNAFFGNTGFCLQSEGDGTWDNDPELDRFNWSFAMDNVQVAGTAASGIVMTGDPGVGAYGACTYNLPCGGGGTATPCGTGYGTGDGFWINVDRDAPGTVNTGATCLSAPIAGTGCYWFGGYPTNPFASFWLTLVSHGECGGATGDVQSYCAQLAPTVTQNCTSNVSTSGIPSATSSTPFTATWTELIGGVNAVLMYGVAGPTALPWSTESRICVRAPTQWLGVFNTGGASTCTGSIQRDLNALLQAPGLLGTPAVAGQRFNFQVLQRDPGSVRTTNYSEALQFVMTP